MATPCPLLIAAPVAFLGGMSRPRRRRHHQGRRDPRAARGGADRRVRQDRDPDLRTTGARRGERVVRRGARTRCCALAASAEQYSSHVLARSVRDAATAGTWCSLPRSTPARRRRTGSPLTWTGTWWSSASVRTSPAPPEACRTSRSPPASWRCTWRSTVRSPVSWSLSDQPRADARTTLDELTRLGITERVMISGDAAPTVAHVAEAVGITRTYAECLPEDKVRVVRQLPDRPVMMVGDGVNDAPVLAVADVGVAMGARGSTAASESADVVILTEDLEKTAAAIRMGRRTMRVALQSIWLGIVLSVGLMLVAATGVIPAVVGAFARRWSTCSRSSTRCVPCAGRQVRVPISRRPSGSRRTPARRRAAGCRCRRAAPCRTSSRGPAGRSRSWPC